MSKNKKLQSDLMLLLTSLIWGSSFIFQSLGANHLGPFTFNTFRYVLAVISLLPAILYFKKKNSVLISTIQNLQPMFDPIVRIVHSSEILKSS